MVGVSSAGALVALLDNADPALQVFALKRLDETVDAVWPDVADEVTAIEVLYEDDAFPERQLAALVASKVYYHLGDYAQSTDYALGAGDLFDIDRKDEYVETIIAHCVDTWIAYNLTKADSRTTTTTSKPDARLASVVDRMLQRCYDDREYKQAIGIALEARRSDVLVRAIEESRDDGVLQYVLDSAIDIVQELEYRNEVVGLLLQRFKEQISPDYFSIIRCVVLLDDPSTASTLLSTLIKQVCDSDGEDRDSLLTAYQMAFDLESSATQQFLQQVTDALLDADSSSYLSTEVGKKIRKILSGATSIRLNLEFLKRNDHADQAILDKIKNSLEARNSIFHSCVTFANAFMHAGTTSDGFFRNNLDWLSKASNWSKFSATAALGVIHKGNLKQATTLLGPYLPKEGLSGSPYSEGGSLYALGLIHANHGGPVLQKLKTEFDRSSDEIIQHGAALGLGVAGMATADEGIYESLKNVLFGDSAVAGEATGLAMGLVMLGSNSPTAIEEMLVYAHETQHEKIVRGLAMGLALLVYGREGAAEGLIEQLCKDDNPLLRHGGMFAVALAYCGTGNTNAFERLLHFAVSDVHDDVRRAAVMGLGFVMFRNPQALCRTIGLLNESYNPHVRYGAAMALGIACAGTALPEALDLLEGMKKDATEFVRQGAFIALAMVLVQHNDQTNPAAVDARKLFHDTITNKHQDAVSKFGASLASGILDAGGRNVTMRLSSASGSNNRQAIVGMAVFTSFWYWFPLAHFLSLAFTPTAIIGLNANLDAPKLQFTSQARPSMFAYTPETPKAENKAAEKVATAVLSTTARAKARAKKAEKEKQEAEKDVMETDEKDPAPAADADAADKMETDVEPKAEDGAAGDGAEAGKESPSASAAAGSAAAGKKKPEPSSEQLDNMSRVLPWQVKHIVFGKDARYTPIKKVTAGVLMLRDANPGQEEDLMDLPIEIEEVKPLQEEEAEPPEDFYYDFHADEDA